MKFDMIFLHINFDNIFFLSLSLHLNLLVYDKCRNIFRSSSVVFSNLQLSSGNVVGKHSFPGLVTNVRKSSDIFRKWSEIFGKSPSIVEHIANILYNKTKKYMAMRRYICTKLISLRWKIFHLFAALTQKIFSILKNKFQIIYKYYSCQKNGQRAYSTCSITNQNKRTWE